MYGMKSAKKLTKQMSPVYIPEPQRSVERNGMTCGLGFKSIGKIQEEPVLVRLKSLTTFMILKKY